MIYKTLLFDIFGKIMSGENFALLRYGDGERKIMEGESVVAQEGWKSDRISKLSIDLLDSLMLYGENVMYFASCPCCDHKSYIFYKNYLGDNFHTSNIFANANYKDVKAFLDNLDRDIVLIANESGKGKGFGKCMVLDSLYLPDDCVNFWSNDSRREYVKNWIKLAAKEYKNTLFIFAVGPMSEPLIKAAYDENRENQYIDFGSSVDEIIHGKPTRPFMTDNFYSQKVCNF